MNKSKVENGEVIEEFREHVRDGEFWEINDGNVNLFLLEAFITNALNQQRTKERERIKLCAKEQSCSGCMEWIANNPK